MPPRAGHDRGSRRQAALAAVNLTLGTSTAAYDETVPEGSIISQDPAAGTKEAGGQPSRSS